MKKIWSILRGFLVFLGVCVVLLAVAGAWGLHKKAPPELPDHIVLNYDFYGTPPDAPVGPAWLSTLMPAEPTLSEVADAIYKAARDKRVEALAVRLSGGDYRWADVQELRAALAVFRAAGKKTYVYAESYGDMGSGMGAYYLATAFDDIWLQPMGSVAITGFHAEMPYFKKVLDGLGIKADIIQKGTYKTAPENALLDHMSDAQRTMLHDILADMSTDFFDAVSKGRHMTPAQIGPLIDGAPYTADEAKDRKLVDTVGYADELMGILVPDAALQRDASPSDRQMVHLMDYLYADDGAGLSAMVKKEEKRIEKQEKNSGVALVYATGMIVSGSSYGDSSMMGERMAYADDVAGAIGDATDDPDIQAIVLRIDSPGGSPSASETIRRAVEVARTHGKYVVVSMGSEAASGGYWIAVDADRIFAQDGTLTGSIGVFGGKVDASGLWSRLGVQWDSVTMGANAAMGSPNRPYGEQEQAATQRMLDDIYDGFVARVAKGRHFAPEVVEGMAQGRVWTGRQAVTRGLVDATGGLHAALDDVAKKLGVAGADALDVRILPEAPSPVQEIMGMFAGGAGVFDLLRPFLQQSIFIRHPQTAVTLAQPFAIRP